MEETTRRPILKNLHFRPTCRKMKRLAQPKKKCEGRNKNALKSYAENPQFGEVYNNI